MSLLGSRTKRVLTYGRRGHRIVNDPDDKPASGPSSGPLLSSSRLENDFSGVLSNANPQQSLQSSSLKKGRSIKLSKSSPKKSIPIRHPLAIYEPNTPGSPAQPSLRKKKSRVLGNKPPVFRKSLSPLVDLDIIVVDDGGRKLSQERRVSRTDVLVNLLTTSPPAKPRTREISRKKSHKSVALIKKPLRKPLPLQSPIFVDSDTENEPPLRSFKSPRARTRAIVLSSDESDIDIQQESEVRVVQSRPSPLPSQPTRPPQPSPGRSHEHHTWIPPQLPVHQDGRNKWKPRQLTPIRGRRIYPQPHPSPSLSVDSGLDAIISFADISISSEEESFPSPPEYLLPLLTECLQSTPHEFSAFIETFPFDPIVHSFGQKPLSTVEFRKIGEASYSEVFGIGNVVLKIIPLRDEDHTAPISLDLDSDSPPPSDAKDVLTEINVTRTIGEICDGFTKLLRAYVVRGKYPSLLLSCWDEFHKKKGSESIKPDSFSLAQTYAIIVLPNGGPDLETYAFSPASKNRWSQASSIFWQVVRTLATAEELVSFEHRDLHWGQILIQNTLPTTQPRNKRIEKVWMDDAVYGVTTTIIDLGLARMDGSEVMTHWTPFEREVFEGKGDYQFDVYRLMREHNGDSWVEYRPLSNVMWLHYLIRKLLTAKRLRPPATTCKTSAFLGKKGLKFTERDCYACLVEMEALIGAFLEKSIPLKHKPARKGHKKTMTVVDATVQRFTCAGDVLKYGIAMGWVTASS